MQLDDHRTKLWKRLRGDLPHQKIVHTIVFVAQQIANRCDLSPRDVGEVQLPILRKVTRRLGNNFDAALYRTTCLMISGVRRKVEISGDLCNSVHGLKDINKTDSRILHLENPNCFALDRFLESGM